jgi:hypothetical protein
MAFFDFDDDITKLRKGKLSARKAGDMALDRLRGVRVGVDELSHSLLANAVNMMTLEELATFTTARPEWLTRVSVIRFGSGQNPLAQKCHSILGALEDLKQREGGVTRFEATINKLWEVMMLAAIYAGNPTENSDDWHVKWWEALRDDLILKYLEEDFCPRCGMDASLATLTISKALSAEGSGVMGDPRTWTVTCCECEHVFFQCASMNSGTTDVVKIQR